MKKILFVIKRNFNFIQLISLISLISIFDEFVKLTGVDKGTRG